MLRTPFTFYRGAALHMAADLAGTPANGLRVQASGDCHLLNFGAFATPERRVIFDLNDFDETLPAPWEWDVKRLAASFVLAGRENRFTPDRAREAAVACARAYREHMAEYGDMSTLDVWYARVDIEALLSTVSDLESKKRFQKRLAKARARSVLEHDYPQLVRTDGDSPTIRDDPPLIFHMKEHSGPGALDGLRSAFKSYRESLPDHRRVLLDRFQVHDLAMKVVGVGSVGTACGILLLMANGTDPLFLQVKEARPSVLEPFAGPSVYANRGQRIVMGSHLMQAASDLFLGWTEGRNGRHFYVRQLRDVKIGAQVELFSQSTLLEYASVCGWALARAHARTGDPVVLSGYMGKSDTFDQAIADFSVGYADQSERDHGALMNAVRAGKLEVELER